MENKTVTSLAIVAMVFVIGFIAYNIGNKASDSVGLPEVEVLGDIEAKNKQRNKIIKVLSVLIVIGFGGFIYANRKNNVSSIS